MKPKVLFVSINFFSPEYLDGANKITYNLLKEKALYSSFFLSLYDGKLSNEERVKFSHVPISTIGSNYSFLKKYLRFIRWIMGQSLASLPRSEAKKLARAIEEQTELIDNIHLCSLGLASCLDYLSEETLKKVSLAAIDSYTMFTQKRITIQQSWIKKLILKRELKLAMSFEKKAYALSPQTVFVSSIDKNFSEKVFPKGKFHTISLGIDTDYFHPSTQSATVKKNQIIFTGNLSYAPNKDACNFLIQEILPLLKNDIPNIKLVLAGASPTPGLHASNAPNIEVTGRVPDLRPYIWQSTLFVCPLRFGAGMKNKVLEVLSMERPSIFSNLALDGIEGLSNDLIVLSHKANAIEWARAITDNLIRYSFSDKSLQKNRTIIKNNYSWNTQRESYSDLFLKKSSSFKNTR